MQHLIGLLCEVEPVIGCLAAQQPESPVAELHGRIVDALNRPPPRMPYVPTARPMDPLEPLRATRYGIDDEHFERDPVRGKFDETS